MSRPKIITRAVAARYAAPNETIIEFSSEAGGGLISFRLPGDGTLRVDLHRLDPTVQVLSEKVAIAEIDLTA